MPPKHATRSVSSNNNEPEPEQTFDNEKELKECILNLTRPSVTGDPT